ERRLRRALRLRLQLRQRLQRPLRHQQVRREEGQQARRAEDRAAVGGLNMQILKGMSLLLDYPTELLREHRDELEGAIAGAREISPFQRRALVGLLERLTTDELMD